MQSDKYLTSFGWKGHGNPLSENGLVHPILIKHKQDRKGIGLVNNLDQKDMWWETMFNNNLQNLNTELDSKTGDIVMTKLQKEEEVLKNVKKSTSPLYTSMFVKGKGLQGTIGEKLIPDTKEQKTVVRVSSKTKKEKKVGKKEKKDKKKLKLKLKEEKKKLKAKKDKKDKKKKTKKDKESKKENKKKKSKSKATKAIE
jgi:nucleolar protein TMA23